MGAGFGWWLRSGSAQDEFEAARRRAESDAEVAADQLRDALQRLEAAERRLRERERAHEALIAREASLESAAALHDARLSEMAAERDASRQEAARLRASQAALNTTLQKERADFEEQRKSVAEKIELLQEAKNELGERFENLANRIFEAKSDTFRKASAEHLDTLLGPFRVEINKLHADVKEASRERHTLARRYAASSPRPARSPARSGATARPRVTGARWSWRGFSTSPG